MHRTPLREDKRFIVTVLTVVAVLGLTAVGKAPNEQVLTFLDVLLLGFMGQSQWGQTRRVQSTQSADPK
jgi:hypothetical protein